MKLALSAILLSAALAAPLAAQSALDAPPPPTAPGMHPGGLGGPGGPHSPHGPMMFGRGMAAHRVENITNSPFTAQFSETGTFTNRDGKQVQHSSTSTVYRDLQGRVREEVTLPPPPPRTPAASKATTSAATPEIPNGPSTRITILDPVAHTITHLNAERKIAYVQTVPADFFTRMQQREDRSVSGQQPRHRRDNAITADLGNKVISGVPVKGERTTLTFPSRDDGAAHTMTHETWFSPDAKFEVSAIETSDRGTHSDTLTSFTKAEPNAALFQVPAGYTSTAVPDRHFGGRFHGGPGRPQGPNGEIPPPPPPM